ncbi:hypothetical protein THAOC_10562, partial [Thalassiosira oceanica]
MRTALPRRPGGWSGGGKVRAEDGDGAKGEPPGRNPRIRVHPARPRRRIQPPGADGRPGGGAPPSKKGGGSGGGGTNKRAAKKKKSSNPQKGALANGKRTRDRTAANDDDGRRNARGRRRREFVVHPSRDDQPREGWSLPLPSTGDTNVSRGRRAVLLEASSGGSLRPAGADAANDRARLQG